MQEARLRGLAGDIDDAPALALVDHHLCGGLDAEECAGQVHVYHRAPIVGRHLEHRLHDIADAGIVDPDVERAVRGDRMLGEREDLCGIAHVACESRGAGEGGGDGGHLVARPDHRVGRGGIARLADVGDDHGGALVGEALRDRLAQPLAAARSGDDRGLARQPSGHRATFSVRMNAVSAQSWNSAAIAAIASVPVSLPNWSMSFTSMIST